MSSYIRGRDELEAQYQANVDALKLKVDLFKKRNLDLYWPKLELQNAKNDLKNFNEWHATHGPKILLAERAAAKLTKEELAALTQEIS